MWIIYSLRQKSVWGKKGDKYSDYVINSGVGKLLWRQMQISLIRCIIHNCGQIIQDIQHSAI